MFFNSIPFLQFFAIVFTIFHIVPHKLRWIVLLIASGYFYSVLKFEYLLFLYVPIIIVYFASHGIVKTNSTRVKKTLFFTGIISSVMFLFVFKYLDLVINTLYSVLNIPKYIPLGFILPIGISFYTFKLLSYLIDVYFEKIKPENHFGIFALYVSFFPQLLAGPIDRAGKFIPQLKKKIHFDFERILSGINLFVWGFFKKAVVSNRLALFSDQVFAAPSEQSGINLLFGLYFYSFQIYCDFSGYSDMAIGVSKILGYTSMENFNFPYFSKNLTQFWNRWHISLSTWLRDYLFLPISYSVLRKIKTQKTIGIKTETIAYAGGITITMFLGGLWHGASWTFVIWGFLHGFYLSFSHFTKKIRKKIRKKTRIKKIPFIYNLISILLTFHFVTLAWVFFRSPSFDSAIIYLKNIDFLQSDSGNIHLLFTLSFVIILIIVELFMYNKEKLKFLLKFPFELKLAAYAFFLIFIIIFSVDSTNEFIYFQF